MIIESYTLSTTLNDNFESNFDQAYLEFYGVNHLRPSYTAWIFFQSEIPKEVTPDYKGYAGTLAVFGHSDCWGDKNHCHGDDGLRRFDSRPSHPMTRAFKRVPVAHALKQYLELKPESKLLDICIYAYSRSEWPNKGENSLLCCKGIQLVTH